MAPINEGIGRRHFLRVFGTAAVALAGGVAAFDIKVPAWMRRMRTTLGTASGPTVAPAVPEMTCVRVGDRLVFHPDVFASVIPLPRRVQGAIDAERLRACVVMVEAEKAALNASWRGRAFMRSSA